MGLHFGEHTTSRCGLTTTTKRGKLHDTRVTMRCVRR